ncbi:plasmid pRiA4b ORF-3 family protein [Candidatus Paracaedibacter symbiosus]|uniref:plasmid pRiA4b ORF-3 family protein n=1 Tax=Candidatus Paracaedibacter symbiosus TaxID=244582 RepID=UPI0004F81948|nr:plasmid pRiA4b ORF-3 family protein [Candidatus Paracaedibacter symbiosus]AIL13662.1 plasmid pRiA4b ORF-3-like family protein [Candidatus Paracaedimonas acanthamoebae]AIL13866.1 plasmid pRiA4b ORF-3-like family protein [Candidatus Paracaedimonas acanthamoebae]
MKLYRIKIALRGISPMVWRRLQIPGNTSLANLHHIIQIANGWEDEYLHQFHIYGKDYGIAYEGGLMFVDNAHTVYMDDFKFDIGDKFTYEYNFFKHWVVDIRIEGIDEASTSQPSVYCIKGNGMPGANKSDEIECTLNLLKAIAHADDTTKLSDLRLFVEALNAVRFNRRHINKRLQTEME